MCTGCQQNTATLQADGRASHRHGTLVNVCLSAQKQTAFPGPNFGQHIICRFIVANVTSTGHPVCEVRVGIIWSH
jgi:hypothetical protein